jgi:hypothetical protein
MNKKCKDEDKKPFELISQFQSAMIQWTHDPDRQRDIEDYYLGILENPKKELLDAMQICLSRFGYCNEECLKRINERESSIETILKTKLFMTEKRVKELEDKLKSENEDFNMLEAMHKKLINGHNLLATDNSRMIELIKDYETETDRLQKKCDEMEVELDEISKISPESVCVPLDEATIILNKRIMNLVSENEKLKKKNERIVEALESIEFIWDGDEKKSFDWHQGFSSLSNRLQKWIKTGNLNRRADNGK